MCYRNTSPPVHLSLTAGCFKAFKAFMSYFLHWLCRHPFDVIELVHGQIVDARHFFPTRGAGLACGQLFPADD